MKDWDKFFGSTNLSSGAIGSGDNMNFPGEYSCYLPNQSLPNSNSQIVVFVFMKLYILHTSTKCIAILTHIDYVTIIFFLWDTNVRHLYFFFFSLISEILLPEILISHLLCSRPGYPSFISRKNFQNCRTLFFCASFDYVYKCSLIF